MREGEYEVAQRETIAEVPGLRIRILRLAAGQSVPWHRHSIISDTFVCLAGPLELHLREPAETLCLEPGGTYVVSPPRPHHVRGCQGGSCRFLLIQGVGEYDYVPCPAD